MLTVSLPPDIEQYVHQVVASGKYRDERELVVQAIRWLRDSHARYQQLRAEIQEALEGVQRGEGIELEDEEALTGFFDQLESEVQAELAAEKKEAG